MPATALADIDAVAATAGPGLVGGLIVGLMTAKAIAAAAGKPLIAVNHLEGHALTARLTDGLDFPYLLLLVSGGHTQIVLVRGVGDYRRWATTIDDALGEAFDKTAKMLGLPYPGGPNVEKAALEGDASRFAFPRPMKGSPQPDFSFSGLKTAVRQAATAVAPLSDKDVADICASFQAAVSDALADRVARSLARFRNEFPDIAAPALVVAGGVAANREIRAALEAQCGDYGFRFVAPPLALCTDNAAMIAWAGIERIVAGLPGERRLRARAALALAAGRGLGAGRRLGPAGSQGMSGGSRSPCSAAAPGAPRWRCRCAAPGIAVRLWARDAETVGDRSAAARTRATCPGVPIDAGGRCDHRPAAAAATAPTACWP